MNSSNNKTNFFSESLPAGRKIERLFLEFVRKKYPDARQTVGYNKHADIVFNGGKTTIEVKQDFKSHYTGNYVVEVEFDGKPSALSVSHADFWVLVDRNYFLIFSTPRLRVLILEYVSGTRARLAKFVGRGDIKSKRALLLPVGVLQNSKYVRKIKYNKGALVPYNLDT